MIPYGGDYMYYIKITHVGILDSWDTYEYFLSKEDANKYYTETFIPLYEKNGSVSVTGHGEAHWNTLGQLVTDL